MTLFRNLYIHIPFCRRKCDYCAFYSEPGRSELFDIYLERLKEDIAAAGMPEKIDTVYVGGGTPTILSPGRLQRLADILPEAGERSIEANPETLDGEKVTVLAENFSRISLGIQSFDPEKRRILGRECSQYAIEKAIDMIAQAQFRHWNIDLIYGIGAQSSDEWRRELETAVALPIDHLSCYALTREENCALDQNAQTQDHEEREADMAELTRCFIDGRFRQYEISNYAANGAECQHNLNVWRGKRYLGIGAAAASFDGHNRWTQIADIDSYLKHLPPEIDCLPPLARAREVFAFNLRTVDGWTGELWKTTDLEPAVDWSIMVELSASIASRFPGMIEYNDRVVRLTQMGRDFWDMIAAEII